MAKVACPACRHMNSFPKVEPGLELQCQQCNQPFKIRGPAPAAPSALAPSASPLQPLGPAPGFGSQPTASPFAPINPQSSPAPQPTYGGAPFGAAPTFGAAPFGAAPFGAEPKPAWTPPPAPGPPKSNNMMVIVGVLGFVGLAMLFCGGVTVLFFMNAKSRVVAAAKNVEAENLRRQQEMQREIDQRRMNQRQMRMPAPPQPSSVNQQAANSNRTESAQNKTPESRPPVTFPAPPNFTPPGFPPDGLPPIPVPPPGFRPGPPPPANDAEKLDYLLTELKRDPPTRPVFLTLHELDRLPVQEDRREDVAAAIEPLLQQKDPNVLRSALRVVGTWGTETNVSTLTSLIESPDFGIRSEAIRALPKISKTEATAEALAAKLSDFSSMSSMRDAFKELGSLGEPALLKRVNSDDRRTRQATHMILMEIGGVASRDALRELVKSEKDVGLKMMAEHTLRRVEARNP